MQNYVGRTNIGHWQTIVLSGKGQTVIVKFFKNESFSCARFCLTSKTWGVFTFNFSIEYGNVLCIFRLWQFQTIRWSENILSTGIKSCATFNLKTDWIENKLYVPGIIVLTKWEKLRTNACTTNQILSVLCMTSSRSLKNVLSKHASRCFCNPTVLGSTMTPPCKTERLYRSYGNRILGLSTCWLQYSWP